MGASIGDIDSHAARDTDTTGGFLFIIRVSLRLRSGAGSTLYGRCLALWSLNAASHIDIGDKAYLIGGNTQVIDIDLAARGSLIATADITKHGFCFAIDDINTDTNTDTNRTADCEATTEVENSWLSD